MPQPFVLIPLLLLSVPIAEIAVFIMLGGAIGLWATLGLILLTAIIGTFLLRHQGFHLVAKIQNKLNNNEIPGRELVHGVMLLVAGVLLLTPGFVTDTCGFLIFIPPVRDTVWQFLKSRITVNMVAPDGTFSENGPPDANKKGPVIDLHQTEFGPADPDSPWKH